MFKYLILPLICISFVLSADEYKNISYYDKDFPIQGNEKELRSRCKLDLITPKTKGFPTLVWFHGGGLSRGKKHYPGRVDRTKIALVGVNYRLSGKNVKCPDYIYDAAAAVAWVIKNIKKYGGDPSKVYIAGHSAGGYLCAMIALDKKYLAAFGVSNMALAGVYPISGQMSTHFRVLAERRMKNPKAPRFLVDELAPLFHASKVSPPMILFCGDPAKDWPSRPEENQFLAARFQYTYKNKKVKYISFPNTNHGSCYPPSMTVINKEILSQIGQKPAADKVKK